jgi:hypothetical protein
MRWFVDAFKLNVIARKIVTSTRIRLHNVLALLGIV